MKSKHIHETTDVVYASELSRIRDVVSIQADHDHREHNKHDNLSKTHARREKIIEIDRAKRALQERTEPNHGGISYKHQSIKTEDIEDVKKMNQIMQFAKVQTIRDAQQEQKLQIQREEKEREEHFNAIMENERRIALKRMEGEESHRREMQRAGAEVILDQIQETASRREEEKWIVDREREHILKHIEESRMLEQQAQEDKLRKQKQLFEEVMEFNRQSIQRKEEMKQRDKEEDLKLLEYANQRDLEEKRREELRKAEAERREAELAELRSHQEKLVDRNEERDAIRAKRAAYAAERAAREKEEKEKERQFKINETLAEARRIQHAEKQLALIEQARIEKKEFDRMMESQMEQEKRALVKEKKELEIAKNYANELRKQIEVHHEKQLVKKQEKKYQGGIIQNESRMLQERVKEIKAEKVNLLVKSGVPQKYCMNLINYEPKL